LALAALAVLTLLAPATAQASADSAVITKDGTLYEVFEARYDALYPGAYGTSEGRYPVLGLRKTPSGGVPVTEIVEGTLDNGLEGQASVVYEPLTQTVFIAYSKYQGVMASVHVAIRRNERWVEGDIIPNPGLYLSLNPNVVVTRQRFTDFDGTSGATIQKWRSIFSIVWWEEGNRSQARYASVFIEDGLLRLDNIVAHNLNDLAGASGSTSTAIYRSLPINSRRFSGTRPRTAAFGSASRTWRRGLPGHLDHVPGRYPLVVPPGATVADHYVRSRPHADRTHPGQRLHHPRGREHHERGGDDHLHDGVPTFYWSEETRCTSCARIRRRAPRSRRSRCGGLSRDKAVSVSAKWR
jgi:hypothetical protein